jgi:enoyl-[acyl-carrier-protein] reductase (NADH)
MSNINLTLTEQELETVISGLLFSCSVNVVSNTDSEYQEQLFNVAKKLKDIKPDIKLNNIQFIQEEDYEDLISEKVLTNFKENLEITSFDCV